MNKKNQVNTQTRKIKSKKGTYTQPRLIKYGEVRSITQAGLGTKNEQMSGQGSSSKKA